MIKCNIKIDRKEKEGLTDFEFNKTIETPLQLMVVVSKVFQNVSNINIDYDGTVNIHLKQT